MTRYLHPLTDFAPAADECILCHEGRHSASYPQNGKCINIVSEKERVTTTATGTENLVKFELWVFETC